MALKGSPVTAAVAALALTVGASSAVGGYFEYQASRNHECAQAAQENKQFRDFLAEAFTDPQVSQQEKDAITALALRHFPVKGC